jgi:hypothetical protein
MVEKQAFMNKLYLRYAKIKSAESIYFRYSFGDLFAIGDYHERGITLAWIATDVILSFVEEGDRLLIGFCYQSILDILRRKNIEYFVFVNENEEG